MNVAKATESMKQRAAGTETDQLQEKREAESLSIIHADNEGKFL